MSDKKLTLADMGLEDEVTPAQQVASTAQETITTTEAGDQVGNIDASTVNQEEVQRLMEEEEKKEKVNILRPNLSGSPKTTANYEPVDLSKFVKEKPKENPIRNTLNYLYDLADKGMEREMNELLDPEQGRIPEAKYKYIEEHYTVLMKRAANNERLMKHIKYIENKIDTDARFDGITEHERKGYILFTVAHDEKVGITDSTFGDDKLNQRPSVRRTSADNSKMIDSLVRDESEDFSPYTDSESIDLGHNKSDTPMIPDISKATVQSSDDDEYLLSESNEDSIDAEDEVELMPESQRKRIFNDYKDQLVNALRLNDVEDIEGFEISTKPINLNSALKEKKINAYSVTWPLQFSGIPVEITPFSGEEVMLLSPTNTNFETVEGMKTVFSTIYRHIINNNKPAFEVWLRQMSDYDIDSMLFGIYAANFMDTNYITYECSNPKCKKLFLVKKDIMEMIHFPNDAVKERFEKIRNKETVMSQMYRSRPRRISDDYAIGFVSQSIYSNLFEPAALDKDFTQKYAGIINIMPNIDKVYKVDKAARQLRPITFGVDKQSLEKTVMKKVKALDVIFKTFTPDQRSIAFGEAQKISRKFDADKITYSIPAAKCPSCGEEIKRTDGMNPLNLLFTRAQLPIVAASIPE